MNAEPKSIWRKAWKGPAKTLGWFALLAGAVFVILFLLGFLVSRPARISELLVGPLILSVVLTGVGAGGLFLIRWLCNWRNFRRFLFGVACFLTLIALAYAEENLRGKRAWEKHRRAWEAKGEKFTLAALAPPPVPDEKNFARAPLFRPT